MLWWSENIIAPKRFSQKLYRENKTLDKMSHEEHLQREEKRLHSRTYKPKGKPKERRTRRKRH